MQRLLGKIKVAKQADEGGEEAARLGTVDAVQQLAQFFGEVRTCHVGIFRAADFIRASNTMNITPELDTVLLLQHGRVHQEPVSISEGGQASIYITVVKSS